MISLKLYLITWKSSNRDSLFQKNIITINNYVDLTVVCSDSDVNFIFHHDLGITCLQPVNKYTFSVSLNVRYPTLKERAA